MSKNNNDFSCLGIIVACAFMLGFSFLVLGIIIKVISMCFGFLFSWKLVLGIYFVLLFINLFVRKKQ